MLSNIPAFYINLDTDISNNVSARRILSSVFSQVERVPGVLHTIGREGCRQAHVKANQRGIASSKPGGYYAVFEDDITLNVNPAFAAQTIQEATRIDADLVLLNIQNYPNSAKLGMATQSGSHTFHRIYGGVGSGLAYIVRHEFGRDLVKLWSKRSSHRKHIDLTWHQLWPSNKVYVHQPLIMLSAKGPSKTGDTKCRVSEPGLKDFNWNLSSTTEYATHVPTAKENALVYSFVASVLLLVFFVIYYNHIRQNEQTTDLDDPDFDQ